MTTEVSSSAEKSAVKGLKGVVAADSSICEVDGTEGKLIYRGYNIHELAEHSTFEETCYLLLFGKLPNVQELAQFSSELVAKRRVDDKVIDLLKSIAKTTHPMTSVRTAISLVGALDPKAEEHTDEASDERIIRLISQIAVIVAAIKRIRADEELLEPQEDLGHSANFMYLLNGRRPSDDEVRAMDLILILHAEHGLNASTFAARVISATLTDMYSAVTGAIGALKGPLHGGANTEVLKTLMEVGSVERVAPWVDEVRANKGKFMGFGHAVYKVEDPRAIHLKELSRRLGHEQGEPKWYDMSVEMEHLVKDAIQKNCNVDFYSASLQHYMGIPGDLFTCVFAASRIAGWCAHVLEQVYDNKIIRPSSNYVGPAEQPYVPIASRG